MIELKLEDYHYLIKVKNKALREVLCSYFLVATASRVTQSSVIKTSLLIGWLPRVHTFHRLIQAKLCFLTHFWLSNSPKNHQTCFTASQFGLRICEYANLTPPTSPPSSGPVIV